MKLILTRYQETNLGTLGILRGLKRDIYTLERRWHDNEAMSCIPAGSYKTIPHGWERFTTVQKPQVWEITNVPNREAILFHAGNTQDDSRGCILVGFSLQLSPALTSIGMSRDAVDYMRHEIGAVGFDLEIIDQTKDG